MPSRSAAEHHEAGIAFGAQRRFAEAVRDYVEAARLNPRFSQTFYNLGVAYGELSGWKANKWIPWTGLAAGFGERFEGDQKECTRRRLVSFIERCGWFLRFLGLAVLLMLCSTGGSAQLEPNTDRWGMDFSRFRGAREPQSMPRRLPRGATVPRFHLSDRRCGLRPSTLLAQVRHSPCEVCAGSDVGHRASGRNRRPAACF